MEGRVDYSKAKVRYGYFMSCCLLPCKACGYLILLKALCVQARVDYSKAKVRYC
jgi:hypothetical protein